MENSFFSDKVYMNLPPILAEIIAPYVDNNRNRDVVLLSSLTALSAVLPNYMASYDSEIVYPHIYTMIVAPAASGKSVMMKARRLIDPVHKYVKIRDTDLNFNKFQSDEEQMGSANKKNDDNSNEKNKPEFIQPVLTIVPANTSNAELMRFMSANPNGIIMIESEMDTMGNVQKNDWGNYSDIMRKAFHHENISVSRKSDKLHIEVDVPKLALLLSGTPGQVMGIMQSKENGLLSRFIIYKYDEVTAFKNVFKNFSTPINQLFDEQGLIVLKMYKKLDAFKEEVIFKLTDRQQKIFLALYTKYQVYIVENESVSFISNLRRLALVLFRICMVLTMCRKINNVEQGINLVCDDYDFLIAMRIIKSLHAHSLANYKELDNSGDLSESELNLLDDIDLAENFTRTEFITLGKQMGFSQRTLDGKLKDWVRKKLIIRLRHGKYKSAIRK